MSKARAPRSETWGHLRVFANTQDGVFAVDQGGRIVLWNKAATRILGFDADEALGRRCCDMMRGFDVSGNLLCYPGCQVMVLSDREQPIHHFDMRTRRKDGQEVWVNISTVIIPADGDQAGGTVHLFRDITQERHVPGWIKRGAEAPAGGSGRQIGEGVAVPSPEGHGVGRAESLTAREREILRMIAGGLTTSAIADKLCISHTTVRNHIQHILAKLGAHSRLEAVTVAFGQHLLASVPR
ncbi:MAG: PAS and helix-turn-helix domain-containing protein [candidate division NC10 bacterium]|nr:PAS and helix-turn-helix domain-containing protein [candidate division NC10 bacterium]MBI4842599.1 PAS and helix-turn-helix domain-containing protein [candidate division NC10 bacterium]